MSGPEPVMGIPRLLQYLATMPDGWQVLHFGRIGNNPMSDPDQDGLNNLKEYLYGTDPQVSEGFTVWTSAAY